MTRALGLASVLALAASCTRADGPGRVAWDRDTCRSCGMAVSDRHFAVQVRGGPRRALEVFDDLGCAVKWLAMQPWGQARSTQLWVARSTDGVWLDARTAHYVGGLHTPMGFGWGALDGTEAGVDFEAVRARLMERAR
jgi:copper chaperone NosL